MSRRVLICGSRDYSDRTRMEDELSVILVAGDVVVHGGAPGADALAGDIAWRMFRFAVEVHQANWAECGRRAGPIRNIEMLESGVDVVYAFVNKPMAESRGTAHCVQEARKRGIPTYVIESFAA